MEKTYEKMSGFATTHGQELEINLAALLYLKGMNSGLQFELATNVKGAGALDDVVFRFKSSPEDSWTTLFVQLKIKANRPVQRTMLTSQSSKGDFSLKKYFESYLSIKKAMSGADKGTLFDGNFEKSLFVILTNAKASDSLGNACMWTLCQAEDFVWCGKGQVFNFEEDKEIVSCLSDSGEEGRKFLSRLQLFCGQPANKLEESIKEELSKVQVESIREVDREDRFNCFLRLMKVWWEKSNTVLHRDSEILRSLVLDSISLQRRRQFCLDLDFEEATLKQLKDSVPRNCKVFIIHLCESSARLSLTKLCQMLGGQPLVLGCKDFLASKDLLLAQWQKESAKGLIIFTNGSTSSHQVDYNNIVKAMPDIPNAPPVVFLCNTYQSSEAISDEFQELATSCVDEFLFSQLKAESREKVLAKEVFFQGHSTTLRTLLDNTPGSTDAVLDACSVVEVFECAGSLTLGSAVKKDIGYYVDRRLERVNVVKANVFQDGVLRESVTVRVTQCETSAVLGHGSGDVREFAGFPRGSATNNDPGLFAKVVRFLFPLSGTFHDVKAEDFARNLFQSMLVADNGTLEVFIGPKFRLGLFECNSVGLRFGQQDAITALWVCKKNAQAGFLFVSETTNENDLRILSAFHQSKHLLMLDDGKLRWIQSHEDIESIRPHIDADQVSTFSPKDATDVEDRLVLVCAEPGMGKSTLMARLAKKTNEDHPNCFVFLVTLNDHTTLFARNKHKDALGFLCSATNIQSHFHRSLLKYALKVTGEVVVLFDGYDEVAPKYVKESCDLLSSLMKETKTKKIWMTSRNSVRKILEAEILKFSVTLRKFDKEDQINFLKTFWAQKSKLSDKELDTFVEELVKKVSQAILDNEGNFMGIPLQTRMLAEVYEDHVTGPAGTKTELPDKLDLVVLLEQFVDKKFNIYYREKLNIASSDTNYELISKALRNEFYENHSTSALVLILGDDDIKTLHMESTIEEYTKFCKEIESGSYKTGIIDVIVNGKPRFNHRVFAEYFVAKWISKHFADNRKLVESKMFTVDFAVVRHIFDRILIKNSALLTAVVNEDLEKVRTLLEREDIKVGAIKDGGGRTALHLAASYGTSEVREENEKRGEILDLLIGKTSDFDQVDDVSGVSPLRYADVTCSWVAVDRFKPCSANKEQLPLTLEDVTHHGMLDNVFDFDLHNLLGFCLDNGLPVEHCFEGEKRLLHRACEQGCLKVASLLIDTVTNQNKSFLHVASKSRPKQIVKVLYRHLKSNLKNSSNHATSASQQLQLANFINMADEYGNTAIHLAARGGRSDVVRYLLSKGGDPRSTGRYNNNTPLHDAARYKRPDVVRVLLEAVDEADRADAVNARDYGFNSVLMCGAEGGCVQCVGQLVEAGGKMSQVRGARRTTLMLAAGRGHVKVVRYLLDNFSTENEGISLVDFINMTDEDFNTAIRLATREGHSDVVRYLLSKGVDTRSTDRYNNTLLHTAAVNKTTRRQDDKTTRRQDVVRVLLKAVDEADRADAVNARGEDGESVLMLGAGKGCVECVRLLVEAGGKISQVNDYGSTALMLSARNGHEEVVRYLLDNFSAENEGISLVDFINMADKYGDTAIRLATHEGHSDVVMYLLSNGVDPQSTDSYKNITPLHISARNKQPDVVRVLLEAVDEADRADAVNARDSNGYSVLMWGAKAGYVECVGLLVEAGGKISQVGDDGRTALMIAAREGHKEVVRYLLDNFSAENEGLSLVDFINMTDKDGNTAIHLAARRSNSDVVRYLLSKGGDPRSTDRDNMTPLHTAAVNKRPDEVRVLLEAVDEADRADVVNARGNIYDVSVLMCGARGGCVKCVGLLVEAGGKMSQVNDDGWTALMEAVRGGHVKVVRYLLDNFSADYEGISLVDFINMTNKIGITASYIAFLNGYSQIGRLLRRHVNSST